jgi:hypothetical protein
MTEVIETIEFNEAMITALHNAQLRVLKKFKQQVVYEAIKKDGVPHGIMLIKQFKKGGSVSLFGDMSGRTVLRAISTAIDVTIADNSSKLLFDNLNNENKHK